MLHRYSHTHIAHIAHTHTHDTYCITVSLLTHPHAADGLDECAAEEDAEEQQPDYTSSRISAIVLGMGIVAAVLVYFALRAREHHSARVQSF